MRLHTDTHTRSTIQHALQRATNTGKVARHVYIETLDLHGSRKRADAYEIRLRAWDKVEGDGRRRPNPGTGNRDHDGEWAATYDEWGWFIAELFTIDPDAIFGSYVGQKGFDHDTHGAYSLTSDSLIPA